MTDDLNRQAADEDARVLAELAHPEEEQPDPTNNGAGQLAPSWQEVDLANLDASPDTPTILQRDDEQPLIYPGKTHLIFGEPESCKGWFVLLAAKAELAAGRHVLYIDFEDSPAAILERLRSLLVPPEQIHQHFHYLRPDEPYDLLAQKTLAPLLEHQPSLVVIDGVTEAMMIHGLKLTDNTEAAQFMDRFPRHLSRTGAAVLLVDHVTKDREGRGRWAIGAQHKLAAIDGAALGLETLTPFGRGRRGKVKITVQKDRPGHIRALCEDGRRLAEMRLNSDPDGGVTIDLAVPLSTDVTGPTYYMERISRALEEHGPLSKNGIRGIRGIGNKDLVDAAIEILINRGFVEVEKRGQAHMHHLAQPFRENPDPEEDSEPDTLEFETPEPF